MSNIKLRATSFRGHEELIQHMRSIYDDSPFIVTFKDKDLRILYGNKMMCKTIAGCRSYEKIVGKSDYDFHCENYANLYTTHAVEALDNTLYVALFPLRDIHTTETLVACHRTPFFDQYKNVIGILSQSFSIQNRPSFELATFLRSNDPTDKNLLYSLGKSRLNNVQLTKRECECLFYFIRGKTCKMIAKILGISYRTVEDYITNIKLKFECSCKSELIDKAIEKGYLHNFPTNLIDKTFIDSLKEG